MMRQSTVFIIAIFFMHVSHNKCGYLFYGNELFKGRSEKVSNAIIAIEEKFCEDDNNPTVACYSHENFYDNIINTIQKSAWEHKGRIYLGGSKKEIEEGLYKKNLIFRSARLEDKEIPKGFFKNFQEALYVTFKDLRCFFFDRSLGEYHYFLKHEDLPQVANNLFWQFFSELSLDEDCKLVLLDLSYNELFNSTIFALSNFISISERLRKINLTDTQMNNQSLKVLLSAFKDNQGKDKDKEIRYLNLSKNEFDNRNGATTQLIGKLIARMPDLEMLDLSDSGVTKVNKRDFLFDIFKAVKESAIVYLNLFDRETINIDDLNMEQKSCLDELITDKLSFLGLPVHLDSLAKIIVETAKNGSLQTIEIKKEGDKELRDKLLNRLSRNIQYSQSLQNKAVTLHDDTSCIWAEDPLYRRVYDVNKLSGHKKMICVNNKHLPIVKLSECWNNMGGGEFVKSEFGIYGPKGSKDKYHFKIQHGKLLLGEIMWSKIIEKPQ